ncbi:DUF1661 domain-containing protein [Porphyromonas gingivalis]|uniref:DUF1661 domain-containing protein n=1 Tax=Porphyromonas gingivalis TaxID=837 RepID=A0AAE9X581_PORGN|nr:DUF1661 domain-containing protein [Porphyromonas gingivalis]MCE8172051.1 DUF1661 domain-containing protein [Porphyromonas gingivalis]MCE8175985.1 DUF1661 domain-containing protein [Porphyromonas gingivalis]MCE8188632.1 DUF1661 domain-containing protein [Porphyromonas gingivalis]MCE8192796.1 DUF1661 domain-containing protein [Porphyromonas gingivalis]MDR4975341.1 DUF1661 domain-containing protein [Porphyromonas gingivalis]
MWSEFIFVLVRKFFLSRTKTKKISRRILKFLEPQSCHVRFEKNASCSFASHFFEQTERH